MAYGVKELAEKLGVDPREARVSLRKLGDVKTAKGEKGKAGYSFANMKEVDAIVSRIKALKSQPAKTTKPAAKASAKPATKASAKPATKASAKPAKENPADAI